MGKNHRHKKALKADKAKTKLKQTKTKFLPKGQNVTDPSFKIRPIVLPEQLKEKEGVPLSRRKLDVKELSSRMRHHNENVRKSACDDLTEMLRTHAEDLGGMLSQIVPVLGTLMQDREVRVRRAVGKAIGALLDNVSQEKLGPFYRYFQVNLRCAMTNIDRNVQEDSLTFLDVFLSRDPTSILGDPSKFLPDFFTLIAKLRNLNNVNLTLTMNLESKLSSIVWRIKVMNHLSKILQHIINKPNQNKVSNVLIYKHTCRYIPLYKSKFGKSLGNRQISQDSLWENHLVGVIPLLCDTITEVMPEKIDKFNEDITQLQEMTSIILYIVVSIFILLHDYAQTYNLSWKSENFDKTMARLASNFPYHFKTGQAKKLQIVLPEIGHVSFNLMLCSLCLPLSRKDSKDSRKMMRYLNKCLLDHKMTTQRSETLLRILKSIFQKFEVYEKNCKGVLQDLVENTIVFFNNLKDEPTTLECFDVLISLYDKNYVKNNEKYVNWLRSLAERLCTNNFTKIDVEMSLKASKMNIVEFQSSLIENLPNILSLLGESTQADEYIQMYLPMLYLYVPMLTDDDLTLINVFINRNRESLYAVNFQRMMDLRNELRVKSEMKLIQYY